MSNTNKNKFQDIKTIESYSFGDPCEWMYLCSTRSFSIQKYSSVKRNYDTAIETLVVIFTSEYYYFCWVVYKWSIEFIHNTLNAQKI